MDRLSIISSFHSNHNHPTYLSKLMIKLWPQSPAAADLTPRASQHEKNPFDELRQPPPSLPLGRLFVPSPGPTTPTNYHPLLAAGQVSPFFPPPSAYGGSVSTDLTPLGTASPSFPSAKPTTQLSLHAPIFNMQQPPAGKNSHSPPKSANTTVANQQPQASTSRGQIHVKLIQARSLNVRSTHARPYVVVEFEHNEFISRDPISETDKEVKGTAVNLSRQPSSNAITALNGIGSKTARIDAGRKNSKGSKESSPSSSLLASAAKALTGVAASSSSNPLIPQRQQDPSPPTPTHTTSSNGITNGLFGRLSAHNPVWKHEVSFDVTSEDSVVAFTVYDRALQDQGFLGTVQIKPTLVHDHTVDQWYKLRPVEDEIVSGEMRVQITYEQYKTKRALTPRDFEFLKLIGRGTFGKVFQVRKRDTRRIYAMKVLSKKEIVAKKEVAHTIGERKILQRSLESPFLVGLKFSFQTETDLYLVTDFKSGGELFWHLQRETRFTEERAKFYIAELILALEHLHKYNIVYRDLKPENILLDATGHVALCDFGLSKADLSADELTKTFCGTTEYLAPEILLDEHGYSKIVDFWSLGVLLFEMCCGWSPFYAEDTQQMYKNICFGRIRFPKGVINDDGKQFVKGLLNRNPKHRLGAQRDAQELKEHPYFKNIDWVALSLKQLTPPFKPVVESDESTNNFDPEFTTADIRDVGVAEMDLDEDDPSEAWVEQSIAPHHHHMPNGPLGSENVVKSPLATMNSHTNAGVNGHANGTSGGVNGVGATAEVGASPNGRSQGIQIKRVKPKEDVMSTPLTSSVQEKFRGFTYHGGESLVASMHGAMAARREKEEKAKEEEAVEDEEAQEVSTEDEYEDFERSAGRLANKKRKAVAFGDLGDDDMS